MPSPLEKARQDPGSMKARILASARKLFGEYGYNRTTTRMIAADVGIDISTLYYHWGEKLDLYEALITDLNDEILGKFEEVEKQARGKSLSERLEISIDLLTAYLFKHPEVSNLILFGYFNKTEPGSVPDIKIKIDDYTSGIAVAMDLAKDKAHVAVQDKARILAVWNCVLNFISGENFFRPILKVDREGYRSVVRETVKFMMVPAFTK
ncbi:MAG: TetR/AcrR family transcriptional regulator [Deltaproteobacteria bacterium]|nr:TetR/AcrR family transcriptional regulator [Deltaproteobacteria bacterium]